MQRLAARDQRAHHDYPALQYAREVIPTFDHHEGFPWFDRSCFSHAIAGQAPVRRTSTNANDAKSIRPCVIPVCSWITWLVCIALIGAAGSAAVVFIAYAPRIDALEPLAKALALPLQRADKPKQLRPGSTGAPTADPTYSVREFDTAATLVGVCVGLFTVSLFCFCCCCCCCGRFCWEIRHGKVKIDISAFVGTGYHCCYRLCGPHFFGALSQCCPDGCRQSNEEDAFRMGVHVDLVERSRLNDVVDIQPVPYFVPFAGATYAYLIIDLPTGEVCAVDPACADLVVDALESLSASGEYLTPLVLKSVLTTHCHHDHSGGNVRLKARYPGIAVFGGDTAAVPGKTMTVTGKTVISLGSHTEIKCIETGGHTRHHISYYVAARSPDGDGSTGSGGGEASGSSSSAAGLEGGGGLGVTKWNSATRGAFVSTDEVDGRELFEMTPLRGAAKRDAAATKDYTDPYNRLVRVQLKRYVGPNAGAVFTGDAIFSGSMGALFEGGEQEWIHGVRRIKALPKETLMFCGHEYTLTSFAFAHWLEPTNDVIRRRLEWVQHRRFGLMDKPGSTLPSTIATELACVFCFCASSSRSLSLSCHLLSRSLSLSLSLFLFSLSLSVFYRPVVPPCFTHALCASLISNSPTQHISFAHSLACARTAHAYFPQLQSIPALSRPRHR